MSKFFIENLAKYHIFVNVFSLSFFLFLSIYGIFHEILVISPPPVPYFMGLASILFSGFWVSKIRFIFIDSVNTRESVKLREKESLDKILNSQVRIYLAVTSHILFGLTYLLSYDQFNQNLCFLGGVVFIIVILPIIYIFLARKAFFLFIEE